LNINHLGAPNSLFLLKHQKPLANAVGCANIGVMIGLFYLGWLFMVLAFAAASAEAVTSGPGLFVSAHELWYALSAKSFTITQIRVERISLGLWDPVLTTLLAPPAWFLFGLPGALLAWFFRPGRRMTPAEEEDHRKHVENLFLYDELAEEAKRLGYADEDDDMSPDHTGHDAMDAMEDEPLPTDEDMEKQIDIAISDTQTIEVKLDPDDGVFKKK